MHLIERYLNSDFIPIPNLKKVDLKIKMRETSFLVISLFYALNSYVQSAPSIKKDFDSEFAKSSAFYAAIVNNAFESKYFNGPAYWRK